MSSAFLIESRNYKEQEPLKLYPRSESHETVTTEPYSTGKVVEVTTSVISGGSPEHLSDRGRRRGKGGEEVKILIHMKIEIVYEIEAVLIYNSQVGTPPSDHKPL